MRKKWDENVKIDNSRGLPHQTGNYELYKQPVLFEDHWEPEDSDSDFEPSLGHQLSSQMSNFTLSDPMIDCDHLIFLVHGYNGKVTDMCYIKNALINRHPKSRIVILKSMEGINYQKRKYLNQPNNIII